MKKPMKKEDEKVDADIPEVPFDGALRKILSAPPAHKASKPKAKKQTKKKTGP